MRAEGSHAPDSACASGRREGPCFLLWQIPGGSNKPAPSRPSWASLRCVHCPPGGLEHVVPGEVASQPGRRWRLGGCPACAPSQRPGPNSEGLSLSSNFWPKKLLQQTSTAQGTLCAHLMSRRKRPPSRVSSSISEGREFPLFRGHCSAWRPSSWNGGHRPGGTPWAPCVKRGALHPLSPRRWSWRCLAWCQNGGGTGTEPRVLEGSAARASQRHAGGSLRPVSPSCAPSTGLACAPGAAHMRVSCPVCPHVSRAHGATAPCALPCARLRQ